MDDHDKSVDALWEELTLDKETGPATRTPFGGILSNPYGYHWPAGYPTHPTAYRTEYRNKKGEYHRLGGPAVFSRDLEYELWYKDGEFHRNDKDGPAFRHKGYSVWYVEGKKHNHYGPAVIDPSGPKQYWIGGQRYSPKEYKKEIARRKRKGVIKEC